MTHPELLALHPEHANDPLFSHTKPAKSINVGIDPDIAKHFYKDGGHWKRRLNQFLRDALFGDGEKEK